MSERVNIGINISETDCTIFTFHEGLNKKYRLLARCNFENDIVLNPSDLKRLDYNYDNLLDDSLNQIESKRSKLLKLLLEWINEQLFQEYKFSEKDYHFSISIPETFNQSLKQIIKKNLDLNNDGNISLFSKAETTLINNRFGNCFSKLETDEQIYCCGIFIKDNYAEIIFAESGDGVYEIYFKQIIFLEEEFITSSRNLDSFSKAFRNFAKTYKNLKFNLELIRVTFDNKFSEINNEKYLKEIFKNILKPFINGYVGIEIVDDFGGLIRSIDDKAILVLSCKFSNIFIYSERKNSNKFFHNKCFYRSFTTIPTTKSLRFEFPLDEIVSVKLVEELNLIKASDIDNDESTFYIIEEFLFDNEQLLYQLENYNFLKSLRNFSANLCLFIKHNGLLELIYEGNKSEDLEKYKILKSLQKNNLIPLVKE